MHTHNQDLIKSCKQKSIEVKSKVKKSRRSNTKHDPLLGRWVIVPGERWDIGGYHKGVVVSVGKYYPPRCRKQQYGYEVHMIEDGVKEWWNLAELEPYLVDVGTTLTAVENMEEVPQVGNLGIIHTYKLTHSYTYTNLHDHHTQVGDRVYASWRGSDEWYYGRVEVMFQDRWQVRYDDGMLGPVESDSLSQKSIFNLYVDRHKILGVLLVVLWMMSRLIRGMNMWGFWIYYRMVC